MRGAPSSLNTNVLELSRLDLHNRWRQSELPLEKHWNVQRWDMRLITTILGLTVIDSLIAWRHSGPRDSSHESLNNFVESLCDDMWHDAQNNRHQAVGRNRSVSTRNTYIGEDHPVQSYGINSNSSPVQKRCHISEKKVIILLYSL